MLHVQYYRYIVIGGVDESIVKFGQLFYFRDVAVQCTIFKGTRTLRTLSYTVR